MSLFLKLGVYGLALAIPFQMVKSETLAEILKASDEKKLADIEAYVAKNPQAEDLAEAEAWLTDLYESLEQNEKAVALIEKRFNSLDPKDTELREYVPLVQRLFEVYSESGQKDKAKEVLDKAEKGYASHPQIAQLKQYLDQLRGQLNRPGKGEELEIAFKDLHGKNIDLKDYKGKVVLVDYWATWCGPCIQELPHVKKVYEEYHSKGFEILAISLDQDKEALLKFIEKENMTWPQAFDGKGWQTELVQKYGITGIPATFLIGKDGKIVNTNLRGSALEKEVKAALE